MKKTLYSAAETGDITFIQKAILNGAHIDSPDKNNQTPLMIAAKNRKIEMVKWLIAHGAEVNKKTINGSKTPLFHAIAGPGEFFDFCIENHADLEAADNIGCTPSIWLQLCPIRMQ